MGAYDLCLRAKPNRTYLVGSPTGIMLGDTTLPTFRGIASDLGILRDLRLTPYPTAFLTNNIVVRFRTAEDPERMRGPNLSGVWLDEASLMHEDAYTICIAALREGGEQGWLSATFTPRGQGHWTYKVFGQQPAPENTELFFCKTKHNPFLPSAFDATVRTQYGDSSRMTRQELDAEFLAAGDTMFARHWFKVVGVEPKWKRRIRAWDLAATETKEGNDPDYTVGALMGETSDGRTCLSHIVRDRLTPLRTEQLIRSIAEYDGKDVAIVIEQEPGAAAKIFAADLVRKLAGYNVRAIPAQGTKAERASPFSAMSEAGHVDLVQSPWVKTFLDEAEQFPTGKHDDQVDAAALAFNSLYEKKPLTWGIR